MLTTEEQLDIISRAWGDQDGYCFFPTIRGDAENKRERIESFQQHRAFHWPREREAILAHMEAQKNNDLYWCPNLFEIPKRREEHAMDEQALWADLDEVDPREIEERYRPSIAWETSPGRYQALWLLRPNKTRLNMSWYGNENHRLTKYLGADEGGWDTTQLLRIPGRYNHKPGVRAANGNKPWRGKLVWKPRRGIYRASDFDDLPEIEGIKFASDLVEAELENIDRHKVWADVKHKLPTHIQQYVQARETSGDRSDVLWQIERELADHGLTVPEIIAIVQDTVWGQEKWGGRADGAKRLLIEATKAVEFRKEPEGKEEEPLDTELITIAELLENVKPPDPLIQDIWSRGSCGFIAGQPKCFKSWFALDMALAVSTGRDFLDYFPVVDAGPVLYVQEEDSISMLKKRFKTMIKASQEKRTIQTRHNDDTGHDELEINEVNPIEADPSIDMPRYDEDELDRFALDDRGLDWLDTRLREKEGGYRAVVLDPLMMLAGELVDEKAGTITERILKPLKQLARKYNVAIIVVHHSNKGSDDKRGGQRMLGSQAFHAWTDDSLFLTLSGRDVNVEVESKNDQGGTFTVDHLRNKSWTPRVTKVQLTEQEPEEEVEVHQVRRTSKPLKVVTAMEADGRISFTAKDIAALLNTSLSNAYKPLQRAIKSGDIVKVGTRYSLNHDQ